MIITWGMIGFFLVIGMGILAGIGVIGYYAHKSSKHDYWAGVVTPIFVVAIVWAFLKLYQELIIHLL